MAMVRHLDRLGLERDSVHTEVDCTYSVVDIGGMRYLQIDTYGSATRQEKGKKSQSIRLAPEATKELKQILSNL